MKHIPVVSSNVASIGFDEDFQVLEVAFLDGSLYAYSGVPATTFEGLKTAASVGQYLDQYVKKAGYPYRRLR